MPKVIILYSKTAVCSVIRIHYLPVPFLLKKYNPAALQDRRNSVKESPDASYMKIAIYVEKLTLYLEVLRLILRIVNYMPLTEMKRLTLSIPHLLHMRAKSSDMYLNIVISQETALTEL